MRHTIFQFYYFLKVVNPTADHPNSQFIKIASLPLSMDFVIERHSIYMKKKNCSVPMSDPSLRSWNWVEGSPLELP